MEKINIGIVGLGWWGPKLLRTFQNHHFVNKVYGYDISKEAIKNTLEFGLNFELVKDYNDLLDNNISSLVIATPPKTHFKLAKAALENGKNVLITKPPTEIKAELEVLERLMIEKNLIFMVDATYIFNPALEIVYSLLKKNGIENLKSIRILRLGDVLRTRHISLFENTMFINNLDIVKDLIFHEISILTYLFGNKFEIESIKKLNNIHSSLSDSAFLFLKVENIPVVIEYSWIFPEKRRDFQFYYDDKFLILDDLSSNEKIWQFTYEDKKKISIDYDRKEP